MSDHIKIRNAPGKWVVRAGGAVLGETAGALELTEGDLPPAIYFPRADIAMSFLDKTESTSHCPWKGDATYFSIQAKSSVIEDAAWSYEDPKPEMDRIKGFIAFYTDKVTVEEL